MKTKLIIYSAVVILLACSFAASINNASYHVPYKMKLSEYGLFDGEMRALKPASGVMPYALNSPLFTDYAQKFRFVKLPEGSTVSYNADSVLQFPVGTIIGKTFYYFTDERNPAKGKRIIETRILLHVAKGWIALPYVWNEEQTEANLEVTGALTHVAWKDAKGSKKETDYLVPNMNQCKGCHEKNGVMTPIGPSARQLNGDYTYESGNENQLQRWAHAKILNGLPSNMNDVPKFVSYMDHSASLDDRARAYLDINCAHCHSKQGPAQTSGLFLDWKTTDQTAYGFYKTPIAAGRGSGNFKYDIVPGKPDESILLYRMNSVDPGVMMPELGRHMLHQEGVELIREWIASSEK